MHLMMKPKQFSSVKNIQNNYKGICFQVPFFIATKGILLIIVIPLGSLLYDFIEELQLIPGIHYISFGWSGKLFYFPDLQ